MRSDDAVEEEPADDIPTPTQQWQLFRARLNLEHTLAGEF